MTLHQRILLGICATTACLIGIVFGATQLILLNNYRMLEEQDAKNNVQRVLNVLQSDIDTLKFGEINWSVRPPAPSRPYSPYRPQEVIDPRLIEKINLDSRSNITLILDEHNNILFQNAVDTDNRPAAPIPSRLLSSVRTGGPLANNNDEQAVVKGLIGLPKGLFMTIAMPLELPAGNGSKTRMARIIWGRYIDDEEIKRIVDGTQLDIRMLAYDENNVPADFLQAKTILEKDNPVYVEPVNDQLLSGYTIINDIYAEPSIMLRIQMPRNIYRQGQESVASFLIILIIAIVGVAGTTFFLLQQGIVSRIISLNSSLADKKLATDLDAKSVVNGSDEISRLSNGIRELQKSHGEAQLKLRIANETLESKIIEHTSTISTANAVLQQQLDEDKQAQAALIEARDKALEALQVKSQLLANVSHDARTPLTIIGLNTEMLQQGRHGDLNSKQNEVLDRILIATRQLINFVTTMLGEAQLNNGKIPLVKVVFEPKLLVEDLVSMLKPLAESKGIQLKSEIDLALPSQLCGDPDRLKQILTNLCENAIKFTDEGDVTLVAHRKDQHHWVIQVKDTGCGIPAEAQNRIFEAYWQLNSTMTPKNDRGVGLGLSIVKQIVQLMSGTITVESEPEKGTTFSVTLPIEQEQALAIQEVTRQVNNLAT